MTILIVLVTGLIVDVIQIATVRLETVIVRLIVLVIMIVHVIK